MESRKDDAELLLGSVVNRKIFRAGILASCSVVTMMAVVYSSARDEDIRHLSKTEKDGARIAFCMMLLSTFAMVAHFVYPAFKNSPVRVSPIVVTSLMINSCALLTNGLLAFAPVVTQLDPVLGTKVYLIRWCEWIPLAGLMTYMSDIVSVSKKEGDRPARFVGLSQSISCLPAILFPFAPNIGVWAFLMAIAIGFFYFMFPRLWRKYRVVKDTTFSDSTVGRERLERHQFGLYLFGVCTVVWTLLVIMYFANAVFHNVLPKGHLLRHGAVQILVDSTFDVIAKAFYARLIVDVHYTVFYNEQCF